MAHRQPQLSSLSGDSLHLSLLLALLYLAAESCILCCCSSRIRFAGTEPSPRLPPRKSMDEQPDCLPIHSKEILTSDGVKLNKKRKLQYALENLVSPLSKHKFGYRFRSTGHTIAAETEEVQNIDREMVAGGLKDGSEELGDSCNDSNSISEGYDATMTLDLDDEAEKSSGKIGSPSVSSNNFNLDSFDTKKVKESGNKGTDSLEDIQLLESAYKGIDDLHPGYEDYGHNIVSELGKNNLEHLDAEIEDLMLYSNDVAPHALLVSPERWSSGRDARLGARKPTIDKEFEQYFSMLML